MKKILLYIILPAFLLCIIIIFVCNALVVNYAEDKIYTDVKEIPARDFGLLLGTSPQSRVTRIRNNFFFYRIDAAEALYKSGKIKYILISGDECSLDSVNEVQAMKDTLVTRGVNPEHIYLDGKGFNTRLSVLRATKIYDVKSYTVISQRFHNERAIYLAEHLGLDTEGILGFNANNPKSKRALITYGREYLARVKMFLNVIFKSNTDGLGKAEPITPLKEE